MVLRRVAMVIALALGIALPCSPVASQDVQEVVVQAPGPALWRVSRGSSTVWVLGVTELLSQGQAWNSARLSGLLDRADALIPAPRPAGSYLQDAIPRIDAPPRHGEPVAELPEPLRSRYYDLRTKLKLDPHAWDGLPPAWAAMMLLRDLRAAAALTDTQSSEDVVRLARARSVRVLQPGRYNAAPIRAELDQLPAEVALGVLADAIDAAEFQLAHASVASAAWARGDVATMRANVGPEDFETWVLRRTVALRQVQESRVKAAVGAISHALSKPGESVMILRMPLLVRRGAALDRLRARGFDVAEPAERLRLSLSDSLAEPPA